MRKFIPNQHLETSYPVNRNTVNLVIFGVPRSASTFTWQVMSDIYEKGVIRTHCFFDISPAIPVVCTVRDWRDAIVSYWRSHYPDVTCMEQEDIYQYVARYQEFIWTLRAWMQAHPNSPVLRYENTIAHPECLFKVAEDLRGPQVTPERRETILEAHSVRVNRAIANNLKVQDRNTLLAPRHVHEAESGKWRDFVDDKGAALLTDLLREELEEWGYDASDPSTKKPTEPQPAKPKPDAG